MNDVNSTAPRRSFAFTKEGIAKLKQRLHALRERRMELSRRLRKLNEVEQNDAIMSTEHINMISLAEAEAARLKSMLQHAKVITKAKRSKNVQTGSTVTMRLDDSLLTYTLVCPPEVDLSMNKISDESPLGQALLDKKVHEIVEVKTPKGAVCRYEIVAIE